MTENKKPVIIVQISDIHVGEVHFVPSLLTRAIDEINELNPDIVIITGDLTANGFRREYDTVKNYLSPIRCKNLIIHPETLFLILQLHRKLFEDNALHQ